MAAHEKLIHDYLAGDLSPEDEAKLFEGLSRNPEWREEMQLQLQMERAMEQDLHSVSIPPQTAGAVFTSLGFRRPSRMNGHLMSDHPKWSQHFPQRAMLAEWSLRRMVFTGLSGIMLLAGGAYVAFRITAPDASKISNMAIAPQNPSDVAKVQVQRSIHRASPALTAVGAKPSENPVNSAAADHMPVGKESSIVKTSDSSAGLPAFPPNEPLRYYDVGNFYSSHYLTPQKIIGVTYRGQIFVSDDSGHSWSPRESRVTSDLFGIHFFGMAHGVAVGADGTILTTSDTGATWHVAASGTKATLSTVRFVSQDTVYICGDDGVMLRSTTGGASWKLLETGIHANLLRMAFQSSAIGDVYGASGVHIATTDGGESWNTIK